MKHFPLAILAMFCCICSTTAFGQNCDANFTFVPSCNTVKFTPDALGAGIAYKWDFGVAGISTDTSNQPTPTYTYFNADTVGSYSFTVRLILSQAGCMDTVSKVVTFTIGNTSLPTASMISLGVGPVLTAPFLHCNASSVNPMFTLSVQNTSTNVGANGSYLIRWGDGMSSSITTPPAFTTTSHTYLQMGLYSIELIASTLSGCADSTHYTFFNGRQPAAGIGISQNADLCCPAAISFVNTQGMENNPPGTSYTYTVDDGDGSPYVDTLEHTSPLGIFDYTFLHGSCDPAYSINGTSPPEQFVVQVVATNLCGVTSSNIGPSISCSPAINFNLVAVACVGDTNCLVNLTAPNYYWNSLQQSCFSDVFLFWQISGGDYTVESGLLGSSALFQSGTDTVCVRYNTPGVFTVRLISAPSMGSPCNPDTLVKTIQILPEPCQSGVIDVFATQTLEVFPNPANDDIAFVRLPAGATELRWFDPKGQQQHLQRLPKGEAIAQLDLSGMSAGIYFLQVKTAGRWFCGRLCRTK